MYYPTTNKNNVYHTRNLLHVSGLGAIFRQTLYYNLQQMECVMHLSTL